MYHFALHEKNVFLAKHQHVTLVSIALVMRVGGAFGTLVIGITKEV